MFAITALLLVLGLEMALADGPVSVEDFFPEVRGNLTKVSWAHAVNDQSLLSKALQSKVMMLEADIVLGRLINSTDNKDIPIMGHPPATTSDLSLEQFLGGVMEHNKQNKNRKGIKLDFKSIEVFEKSIEIIDKLYRMMNYPVWINADILAGPVNAPAVPVDPVRFFKAAKNFNQSALSIGWTTRYPLTGGSYSDKHVEEMLKTIKANNVQQPITFPVRAAFTAESLNQMKKLIQEVQHSTLTIWSSSALDRVDVVKLRNVIKAIGLGKVYIDVPESLLEKLHLETIVQ